MTSDVHCSGNGNVALYFLKELIDLFIVDWCLKTPTLEVFQLYHGMNSNNCPHINVGPSRSWSYGIWIYNYLCNQCLSPLQLWVRISPMERCTRYYSMW